MEFSTRCHYWFILQVVAIAVCEKASSSTKTMPGCVGSRLDLRCPSTKVINVTNIYRGISSCNGAACCIKDADCSQQLSEAYKRSVHERCDDQQHCTVDISFEKVPCAYGWWLGRKNIDGHAYEKITYICKDDPRVLSAGSTTSNPLRADSTDENILYTSAQSLREEPTKDNVTSSADKHKELYDNITEAGGTSGEASTEKFNLQVQTFVMVIVCLIILIAIVVLVIVVYRRRKMSKSKLLHPTEMTNVDNGKNETAIYANETQETSLHENNDSLPLNYSLVCKADLPMTEEDPTLYSDVEDKKIDWHKSGFDLGTTKSSAAHNAANQAPNAGPDVYAVVNKPSTHAATSSTLKTGVLEKQGLKGFATTGDGASSEVAEDIYANEPAAVSSTRSGTGTVLKTPSPQDVGDITVIENDLYCH